MARSHPPTLIRLAERALRDECRLERGERLLVATSGGGDSSALLHVLSRLAPKLGVSLVAHGVDHGLRPESAEELDLVAALAGRLGIPFERTRVSVVSGGNLQARARDARRAALDEARVRAGATRIATAHHADDRAETVLIRLLHGATPAALAVLPPRDGRWVRPLVRARKRDVPLHLERHGIPFADDPSNQDRRFLRVRVRLEVLPLLEQLSPAIVSHLTNLADDLATGLVPVSVVADPGGQPVPLRRAHVSAVRRAVALGRAARVRLPRGLEIVVDPKAHGLRMDRVQRSGDDPLNDRGHLAQNPLGKRSGAAATSGSNRKYRQKGGVKPGKSG